jgi:hypothetical protein
MLLHICELTNGFFPFTHERKTIDIAHLWAHTLLNFLSFATSHYATGMQLVVICNYLGDVCNYKFGIA